MTQPPPAPAASPAWFSRALADLRGLLVRGEVYQARLLANHIGEVLGDAAPAAGAATPGADGTELQNARACTKAVGGLLSGIEAAKQGDWSSALALFEQLNQQTQPVSIRWMAAWWRSQVLARRGESEDAEDSAVEAMELASELDQRAVDLTRCLFAELEALDGSIQQGLDRIAGMIQALEARADQIGLAHAWMTQAWILAAAGMEQESISAAENAHAADEAWPDPLIFLSRRMLALGDLDQALGLLSEIEPRPPEVARDLRLLASAAEGQVPVWVLAELQELREQLPSEEVIGQLRALSLAAPDLVEVQEALAWKRFWRGHHDEAQALFVALSARALDPDLEASILLGLRCATNAIQRRQETSAALAPATGPPAAAPPQPEPEEEPTFEEDVPTPGVFVGALELIPVPELLEFLRSSRRSGLLMLVTSRQTGSVCIRDGLLAGATSPSYQHVGERLHESGEISALQLCAIDPEGPDAALGWAGIPGEIHEDVVHAAFERQIRAAVGELVTWDNGQFSFQPVMHCPDAPPKVLLDTQEVLLDAVRQLDEQNRDQREPRGGRRGAASARDNKNLASG